MGCMVVQNHAPHLHPTVARIGFSNPMIQLLKWLEVKRLCQDVFFFFIPAIKHTCSTHLTSTMASMITLFWHADLLNWLSRDLTVKLEEFVSNSRQDLNLTETT